jgi:hypothetical protein
MPSSKKEQIKKPKSIPMRVFILILFLLTPVAINAQIYINEISPTNLNANPDQDGDYPDWIELYNAGASAVNLSGYKISDDDEPKWSLPGYSLPANSRATIFCSGKNRPAPPLPGPSVNHWETVFKDNHSFKYLVPTSPVPATWKTIGFADGSWQTGNSGFGYGDGDDNTTVPSGTISVYLRKTFNVIDKTKLVQAILSVDYDDGFVAYLNGTEIYRSEGMNGNISYITTCDIDHEAALYAGDLPFQINIDPTAWDTLLVNGTNVIAISVHNFNSTSTDLTMRPFLHVGISDGSTLYSSNPTWFHGPGIIPTQWHTNFKLDATEKLVLWDNTGTVIDSITYGKIEAGHVRARIPDGGGWCYSSTPTHLASNTGTCYPGYSAQPTFSPDAGFYTSAQNISISANAGATIRYTTNGSYPSGSSSIYATPINVTTNKIIKARAYETGKLPSPISFASIFIGQTTQLPVISISAPNTDLFNDGGGGPGIYDNTPYGGGLEPILCHLEYFGANKNRIFAHPTGIAVAGNYSTTFPQKGLQFTNDEEFNSPDNFDYPVFGQDKPYIERYHSFRLRNGDNDYYRARMRDVIVNRMALYGHATAAGYVNVSSFINGAYWGHYTARERLDRYFLRDNYGMDPDEVDMVKCHVGSYSAEAGNMREYNSLYEFLLTNNMANASNYALAKEKINIENWVDYMITEIYFANHDWIPMYHNNMRCFRERKPNAKWNYLLWDCAFSQDNGGQSCTGCDVLNIVLTNNSTRLGQMFNSLIDNTEFKNYFINRFADVMNYVYSHQRIMTCIDENTDAMISEMDAHGARWNTNNAAAVLNEVQYIKDFHQNRKAAQRNQIVNNFNLPKQVTITIQANPDEAGYVKISTIIPTQQPWAGFYFDGVPITFVAVANPGYQFTNWSANGFIDDVNNRIFTNTITANTTFTANFTGSAIPNPVVISELNFNSDSTRSAGDWLELHNPSSVYIDVSDWMLKDEKWYNRFVIPGGTIIPPGGYLVLAEDLTKFSAQHPTITNVVGMFDFDFSNKGEQLYVMNFLGDTIINLIYNDAMPWPPAADGYGTTMERVFPVLDHNLPAAWFDGCTSGSPGTAFFPCPEQVIFNEINYKSPATPDASDWIELYNRSGTPVDISGWKFADEDNDAEYVIPSGTILPANGFLAIYSNLTKFDGVHPGINNKSGPFNFGLSGDGEVIRLYDASGKLYLTMFYNDTAPWPITPDGQGPTLELRASNYHLNDGNSWAASCGYGTPGAVNDAEQFNSIPIYGELDPCGNGAYLYNIDPIAGATYNWYAVGGTVVQGQGTNKVVVQWNNGQTGQINVIIGLP